MGWISSFVPKLFKKTIPRSLAAVAGRAFVNLITLDFGNFSFNLNIKENI